MMPFATLFDAAAKDPAVFGILFASQTAFHIFLFSDTGQLSHEKRSEESWRGHLGYFCIFAFIVGLGCAVAGLATSEEPRPLLALIATGATLVQALCAGLLPIVSDLSDQKGRTRLKIWGTLFLAAIIVFLVTWLAPSSEDDVPNLSPANYTTLPANPTDFEKLKASRLAVVLCLHLDNSYAGGCTTRSKQARIFRLRSLHHEDLRVGADYWDYSFTRPGDSLRFLYRKNPSQSTHWGFVRGETDSNTDFSQNKVYGLEGFGDTGLARNVLEPQADDAGEHWAREGGVITTTHVRHGPSMVAVVIGVLFVGAIILIGVAWIRRILKDDPGS